MIIIKIAIVNTVLLQCYSYAASVTVVIDVEELHVLL